MILIASLCYVAAVAIIVACICLVGVYFKKTGKRLSPLHSFLGAVGFAIMLVGMFVLMLYAFSETSTMYMTALMPEWVYKITVALLFFIAIGLIRYFTLNAVYFSKTATDNGYSFLFGFGIAGGAAVALYCVFMLVYVIYCAFTSDFVGIEESVMMFENGARVSVFEPFYSHIFVALIFAVYTGLMLVWAMFMDQHASLPFKARATVGMYAMIGGSELLMICVILFASAKISAIAIAVICAVIALLASVALRLLYKYKEELPYDKQFE